MTTLLSLVLPILSALSLLASPAPLLATSLSALALMGLIELVVAIVFSIEIRKAAILLKPLIK